MERWKFMKRDARRRMPVLITLAIVVVGLFVLRLMIDRPPGEMVTLAWPAKIEWLRFRFNAALVAAVVGASLALSGLLLQTMLRNPLASPYILGLSSGAGLGVMFAAFAVQVLAWTWLDGVPAGIPAVVGATIILVMVFLFGQRRGRIDPLSLVLVGVVLSALCNALIMLLQHLAPGGVTTDVLRWMFGRIPQGIDAGSLAVVTGVMLGGTAIAILLHRALDATALGDDEARSVGVSLGWIRLVMFMIAGVLAAAAVAIAGPIGFVGIIAPHITRLLVGAPHRTLIVASVLGGAALLLAADITTQFMIVRGGRLPIGVFTAILGGPFFIWLLRSRRVWL